MVKFAEEFKGGGKRKERNRPAEGEMLRFRELEQEEGRRKRMENGRGGYKSR